MGKSENKGLTILISLSATLLLVFALLYYRNATKVEDAYISSNENTALADWSVENSAINNIPLEEDKSIYSEKYNNELHDIYISVFPTKDETGAMLDFSSFGKHVARDHTYNPVLNCNIQILSEGENLDPLLNVDAKNATIRVRGNSSRGDEYKSYKIKISDDGPSFEGQTVLNLNKHSEDFGKVTTKFCTEILQDVDNMVSYRTNFVRLWIRDASLPKSQQKFEYYGLFTHTEQPNKTYLEARGLSSNCVMYKARDFSFKMVDAIKNTDDPEYSEEAFEEVLGIREGSNHEKLIEMLEAVNDESRDFEEVFETYFNEDNYLTWLAFNLLVGGEDILNHNFILYSPNNSKTWYFFTWDFDSNMQKESEYLTESLEGGQKLNQVVLHKRYLRIPGNLEKLKNKMLELKETYFTEENINNIIQGYIPVLEKTMYLYPDIGLLRGDMTPPDLINYVKSFSQIIEKKYNSFLKAFEYPAPMFVNIPTKNANGTLHISWDNSYSYQGRTIKYNVKIAKDCYMNNIVYEKNDIIENEVDTDIKLDKGVYYVKVTAKDKKGYEQLSLEHYEFAGERFIYENGVLEFNVE